MALRIVLVGPYASERRGTVPARLLPIARRLARDGHKVLVLLPPYDDPRQSGRRTSANGVPVFCVPLGPGPPALSHFATGARMAWEALRWRPHIVHVFKPRGPSGLTAMLLIARRKLRQDFAILIDSDDWEGRGGFYEHWRRLGCYPWYQLAFADFQDRSIPPRVDAVTVASRTLQARMWSLGVPPHRVFYVPNGARELPSPSAVDEADDLRRRLGLANDPTIVLYTRFEFRPERVVRILEMVRESVKNVRLLVIGEGLMGEERRFEALIRQAGMADHVVFLGWVDYDRLRSYLSLGDVAMYPLDDTLVNRSRCAVKLAELISLGIPVVADRVGQNGEYLQDEVSGLLVDPENHEAFKTSLVRLLTQPELRTHMGKAAALRAQTVFGWDQLAAKVEEAYAAALRRRNVSSTRLAI
jgi:glycosyltransferase involved in cell wall biosynthesis